MSETIANPTPNRGTGGTDGRSNGSAPLDELIPPGLEETLREGDERARDFIRRHPIPVVLGAFAVGYAVARMLRSD